MRFQGRTTRGFTLVEVLICVGILALLLGILVPVVNRARSAARVVQCTGNLRQIDASMRAWSQKRNDMRLASAASWTGTVRAIITDGPTADQILACPEASATRTVTTTTTPAPDPTLKPGVEFEKNNKPHSVTWQQVDDNTWLADQIYHKNWPNHAVFKFTRVGNTNDWLAWPISMDPKKTSVGPPLTLVSLLDNVTHSNVQIGQSYPIKGTAIAPVTNTSLLAASSYGYNNQMDGVRNPKGARVLVMDYAKTEVDFNGGATDDTPKEFLVGRHYRNQHNVLFSDGSVRLLTVKELSPTGSLMYASN